jgi:catechol 2,3-dioxygenase-like lactoylglutathione lyase family enzyme
MLSSAQAAVVKTTSQTGVRLSKKARANPTCGLLYILNHITNDCRGKESQMQVIDKLMMFSMAVSDMPKAKAFYADKLGLKVATDFRQDDHNWWVTLTLPQGGVSVTLTTNHENMKPGTIKLYLATSDIAAAHKQLSDNGVKVNEIKNDLFGPGSGVKWLNLQDPDGNQVLLVQA